ncbi:13364_t:CDS:2, partial [Ambispora leptoticha]
MVEKTIKDQIAESIEKILESDLSPYEKKVALFNFVKSLEVGIMTPEKKKRINYLLQGHLYNELAKQCKLKLAWDKSGNYKLYQNFQQNEEFEEEEGIDWWEEELSKGTKKVDDDLTRRPIKFKHQDLVDFVEGLKKAGVSYKEIAKGLKRSVRMNKKVKTLKEMSDYVFSKTNKRFCVATISLVLKKIKYSYQTVPYRHPQQKQNLPEVIEFMERINKLPSKQILSTDESGFPLNLALRRGGIIQWNLVKDTVNTEVFANFLSRVKLSDEEKYYLLLDNIRFHHAKRIKELLVSKNIEPRYIVASNPYLNPVEEIFNVIKQYVRKQRPRTEEELSSA